MPSPATQQRSVGRAFGAWCALVALLLAFGTSAAGAAEGDGVRTGELIARSDGAYTLVASPPAGSPALVPPDGFTVAVDRKEVPAEARPRDPAELGVAVVVAGQRGTPLADARNAAAAFVRALPAAVRVAVIGAGTKPVAAAPLGTDRAATISAIAGIEEAPGPELVPGVDLAVETIAVARRRAVVVFGPVGPVPRQDVLDVSGRLRFTRTPLFAVAEEGAEELSYDLAVVASGGQVAADGPAIADQLALQYLVTFEPPARLRPASRVQIAMRGQAGSGTALPVAILLTGEEPGGKGGGGRDIPVKLVAAAAAGALLLLVVLLLLVRRRRSRSGPAFRVKTTRAVIAAPPAPAEDLPAEALPDEPAVAGAPLSDPVPMTIDPPADDAPPRTPEVPAPTRLRPHRVITPGPRTLNVDDALERLESFAARWQPRSQGVFFADEALAIHRWAGGDLDLETLSCATVLERSTGPVGPVVRTVEALRWSLVRRSQGARWSDVAVEAASVVRGEIDPGALAPGSEQRAGSAFEAVRASGSAERLRSRRLLDEDVLRREPVRAAAIVRERMLEYQWFGEESDIVSRILVPVLLYERVPAAVPYIAISRHLGEHTDVSTFYEAATDAAEDATRRLVQLRALRSRYQEELDGVADTVVDLLFSVPVVTAAYLAERLYGSTATVTALMDQLVSTGVVEPVRAPTRRGDPAWVAAEVLGVFDRPAPPVVIRLDGEGDDQPDAPTDRGAHPRRAAPARPRRLQARPGS